MPAIIAATDYSPIGENAVYYAAALAAAWKQPLIVVHAYYIPVTFNDPAMPAIIPQEDLIEVANSRMDKTKAALQQDFPETEITTRVEYGDAQDVIADIADEFPAALVVVGSHGEDDADMWMGSTTLDLLRHLTCPVLAVPPDSSFKGVSKICLALDFSKPEEMLPTEALRQLLEEAGGELHLLHVAKEGDEGSLHYEQTRLPAQLQGLNVSFHEAHTSGSVDEKIAEFCEARQMDWLSVIPKHHSFWESLFHKSHTKQVIRVSHIPVLALHMHS